MTTALLITGLAVVLALVALWKSRTGHKCRWFSNIEQDRRRFISPGIVVLFMLVMLFGVIATWQIQASQEQIQDQQDETRRNSLSGCLRANAQNAALLDLGIVIREARNLSSTSPRVRAAAPRFLERVKRMEPSLTTYALRDLAIILGGDTGVPNNPEAIIAAEEDFIEKAEQIERPRDCEKLYG